MQATIKAVAAGSVTLDVQGQSVTVSLPGGLTLPASVVGQTVTINLSLSNGSDDQGDDDAAAAPGGGGGGDELAPRTNRSNRAAAPETGRPLRGPSSSTRTTGAPSPGSAARSSATAQRPRTRRSRRFSRRTGRC